LPRLKLLFGEQRSYRALGLMALDPKVTLTLFDLFVKRSFTGFGGVFLGAFSLVVASGLFARINLDI
jgi:hypothetical protein